MDQHEESEMSKKDEALKLALEALTVTYDDRGEA